MITKQLKIWFNLICRDCTVLKKSMRTRFINTVCITAANLLVFAYFIPGLDQSQNYGAFIFFGAIAIYGFFDVISFITGMLSDVEGDNTLSYNLAIPLHPKMVFFQIVTYWAICTGLIGVYIFPLGKLFLWNSLSLGDISYIRFIPAFFTSCFVYGTFALWLVSMIKSVSEIQTIWFRVITPLFMFGAYFFSWKSALSTNGYIAYAMLINPLVYTMESIRSAALGPNNYIPFWVSMSVMWTFNFFFFFHGTHRLKKWLDHP